MATDAGGRVAGPSFWISFAKTLSMMLLCGVVGPVFLVIGIAMDDPAVRWPLWWGLVITVADVALAAVVARSSSRVKKVGDWQMTTQLYGSVPAEPASAPRPSASRSSTS